MIKHRHFITHKPYSYLSQFVNNQSTRKNKKLLGELHDFPKGTMAIGRLDQDSEGLLLLTTDGKVSLQVRSKNIEKEYYVQVDGDINVSAIANLKTGVEIGIRDQKYITLPCEATILNPPPLEEVGFRKIRDERHGSTSWLSITIKEGKNRQVRKMTAAIGFPTLRLIRVRIGNVHLNQLPSGEVKEVDDLNPAIIR